jgi:hypothetical protein
MTTIAHSVRSRGVGSAPEFPSWTALVPADEAGGRYPLAMEAVGSHMVAAYLLPAITNATPHPRYYSFFAWVFDRFDKDVAPRVPESERAKVQRRWRAHLESAFRACTLYSDPTARQIIGYRSAIRLEDRSPSAVVQLDGSAPTAFAPQNYGAAFAYLGLGYRSADRMHLTPLGREAAEAFHEALTTGMSPSERQALLILLSGKPRIPARVLFELAERFRVRAVRSREPEHAPLVQAFFRLDPSRLQADPVAAQADGVRAVGLGLLLDLVGQSDRTLVSPGALYSVWATSRFSNGRRVSFGEEEYGSAFAVWQRFQERQHQKLAVNAVWHEVLNGLEDARGLPVPAAALVGRCQRLAASSSMLRKWMGSEPLQRTVAEALVAVVQRLPITASDRGAAAYDMAQSIMSETTNGAERVGTAVVLLLAVVAQWREERASLSQFLRDLHAHGGAARLALPWMADELQRRESQTLGSLIQWLVEWCVLSQSMRVAYEKIEQGDRFFIQRVDGGYIINGERQLTSAYFSYDSSRLAGAMSILRELSLVRRREGYELTNAGERVRRAIVAEA